MLIPEDYIQRFLPIAQQIVPDLTFQELNLICRAPFVMLRKKMQQSNWPTIRFTYWGVYRVKKKQAEKMLPIVIKAYDNGHIPYEQMTKTVTAIRRIKGEIDHEDEE